MGRNKLLLRLGDRSITAHLRGVCHRAGLAAHVQVADADAVAYRGPLGGIYTALSRLRCEKLLFLACDMPFIEPEYLRALIARARGSPAVFTVDTGQFGFPAILARSLLPEVAAWLNAPDASLQGFARKAGIGQLAPASGISRGTGLNNLNAPGDLRRARSQWQLVNRRHQRYGAPSCCAPGLKLTFPEF